MDTHLLQRLAGSGPCATEHLGATNRIVMADLLVPLADRIELVLEIVGRPMQYHEVADVLGRPLPLVLHTLVTHS
jgi:hypothetical protein